MSDYISSHDFALQFAHQNLNLSLPIRSKSQKQLDIPEYSTNYVVDGGNFL